jgi:septal ring factor EnvC (AmiA/AmiB activator)
MTDAATIAAGFQSLKAAFEIGKALLNLGISAEVQDRIREMNEKILTAQESAIASRDYQSALLKQIGNLEEQIADFETWETEAETYQLKELRRADDPRGSILAYAPKEGTHASEPAHLLCAECYSNRHKSILQHQEIADRIPALLCLHCDNLIYLEGERPYPLSPKRRQRIKATW